MALPDVSIVVLSYNYGEYLSMAIESALGQHHPPIEVLVVDDGSTDGSREIIERYADHVRPLFKANGGNSSAVNAAFPLTRGEIVMFLDSDDFLHVDAVGEVVRSWDAECAKVQFRLSLVDAEGNRRGVDPPPTVEMPQGDVLPHLLTTGRYVTPVTTGNAFRRVVLERILPIPEHDFHNTNDGYLNAMCAFEGPIRSIDRELGSYRLHGRNLWAFSGEVTLAGIRQRLDYEVIRARYLADAAAQRRLPVNSDLSLAHPEQVFYRLLSLRCDRGGHPVADDAVCSLLRAGLLAVRRSPTLTTGEKGLMTTALLFLGASPLPLASWTAEQILASRPRPGWVRAIGRLVRRGRTA